MKDILGNELKVGDEVYVACSTGNAIPYLEKCTVVEFKTKKKDGTPMKHPMMCVVCGVPDAYGRKIPTGIREENVRTRVIMGPTDDC